MPRRSRVSTGQFVFHILNRAVQGVTLFEAPVDYQLFVDLLAEAVRRFPIRVLAFAIMPNHWHIVLWPRNDSSLSPFMKWLTGTHAMKWRATRGSQGRGAVYQGRFKAIAVQHDAHFLRLCRYVERNPVRARLVGRAEDWRWSSAAPTRPGTRRPVLSPWPVPRPADWSDGSTSRNRRVRSGASETPSWPAATTARPRGASELPRRCGGGMDSRSVESRRPSTGAKSRERR